MPRQTTRTIRSALTLAGAVCTLIFAMSPVQAEEPTTRPLRAERRGGGREGNDDMRAGGDREGENGRGKPDGARRQGPPQPGQLIEQMRKIINELNPTEEQKAKIETALKTAADAVKEKRDALESMEPQERREQMEEIMATVRKTVSDALTEEQRQALRKRMGALRGGGGQAPGGEGTAPTTRPGPFVERFQQNMEKLDLTDDQRKKVESVLADAKTQLAELREGLVSGDEAAREKLASVMMDVRREVGEILTPEQREKAREMMAPPPPPPGDRPPGREGDRKGREGKPARGGNDMMDEGDEMRDRPARSPAGKRPGPRPRRDDNDNDRAPGPTTDAVRGPAIGSAAPAFELTKLDGKPVRLSSFQGRVGVIVFGSHSSPSFRQRAPELEALAKRYGSRAQFLIIYTKEAHPAGEWEVDRNKDTGISVEAHKDADARAAQAEKAGHALKLTIPLAPDAMDDAVSKAFDAFPNGAIVLSRNGTIVARQQWVDPSGLERRIEQALQIPTSKPAVAG